MKKTIFYDTHIALGAKMAPFGGYDMPIQYDGIVKEHFYTRESASLFDTCHMGEFRIEGKNACADLDHVLSCKVSAIKQGQCKYGFICNPQGGVIDDQVIYRLSDNAFFMVINASTQDNDFNWIKSNISSNTKAVNISAETAKIDIQGPKCAKIVKKLLEKPIDGLTYYGFMHNAYMGKELLISRTGYTGEIGFELYCDEHRALKFWNDCMELGAKPAGLGARDTLRLEMGYPLYGHELSENRNAAESGFARAIAIDKEFLGSKAVCNAANITHMLSGIMLDDRRAARNNDTVVDENDNEIGLVTSGSFSPSLERAIALAYVRKDLRTTAARVYVRTDRHKLSGLISDMPFYKPATARKKLSDYL
jgi:glycine cleavage system T protein